MIKVLITGSKGFIAKNLTAVLAHKEDVELLLSDRETSPELMSRWLEEAHFIYHLAGVNRPECEEEYEAGKQAEGSPRPRQDSQGCLER